jgi:Bifunctional DNA primase/polymerase, N-terminal
MTASTGNKVLARALAYARHGWPVFPCQPGRKTPATAHGCLDASTDPARITAWFAAHPGCNLAIATGLPGPDVLDVDVRPSGSGFPALEQLARAGLTQGAAAWVTTPGGGVHAYFAGSRQRNGHLAACHLDFRSAGGYVLAPPSVVGGRPYQLTRLTAGTAGLNWERVTALLQPARRPQQCPQTGAGVRVDRLAAWVARQEEGNRNDGLFWAANRVLDAGRDDLLGALAAAARYAGLSHREITATLDSARRTPRTPRARPGRPDPQAETGS